ncbi:FG-GAP-like repeat-containing protein [Archangium primigenium]|uniref:FG-GAP-like repeat-containing protein n=1 Tax=[Archangium] primigenium TaxID=2792470 RepID=UPI00195E94A0|nr:VCBS repeat-containing protein [Archangium primigenium]
MAGLFSNDRQADIAAFYDYGNANTGLWLLTATESGAFSPSLLWKSGAGGWAWDRTKLVSGDFTGDGKEDIAAFYDYGNANTGLWIFRATGKGSFSASLVWTSGPGNWIWSQCQLVAGDFTGDGRTDIAAFYDYGNANTGLWLFTQTETGTFSLSRPWLSGPGNWIWKNASPVAGDFTGDGRADIAAFYDYGNANTGLWLFTATGTGAFSLSRPWLSGPGNWIWKNASPVAGDFTGDGKADIAAFYNYGNANTGLWLFTATGTGAFSLSRPWLSGLGQWDWNRGRPVAGDFTGDGKADIAAFYFYDY